MAIRSTQPVAIRKVVAPAPAPRINIAPTATIAPSATHTIGVNTALNWIDPSWVQSGNGVIFNGRSGIASEAVRGTTLAAAESTWAKLWGKPPAPAKAPAVTPAPAIPAPPVLQKAPTSAPLPRANGVIPSPPPLPPAPAPGNLAPAPTPTSTVQTTGTSGTVAGIPDSTMAALLSALAGQSSGLTSPDMSAGVPSTGGIQAITPVAAPSTTSSNPAVVAIVAAIAVVGGVVLVMRMKKKGAPGHAPSSGHVENVPAPKPIGSVAT